MQYGVDVLFSLIAIIPFLLSIAFFVLIVWFAITLIKTQKEKNELLREISKGIQQFHQDRDRSI